MSIRTERVRGHIRKEIAEMLLKQEVHDPRLKGVVSITDVRMSPDLQHATVYFSVMGHGVSAEQDEGDADGPTQVCQRVLTHASGFIRTRLGRRLKLRHTPQLRFLPDDSMNYGRRIENLLDSLPTPLGEEQGESFPVLQRGGHSPPVEEV